MQAAISNIKCIKIQLPYGQLLQEIRISNIGLLYGANNYLFLARWIKRSRMPCAITPSQKTLPFFDGKYKNFERV